MEFRKSAIKDIDEIMKIINEAKLYFKENNINQWQDGYPDKEVILNDIKNEESFVVINDNKVIGTVVISFKGEKTYNKIYEGTWLSNNDYAVIHRIAISNEFKGFGIGKMIIEETQKLAFEKNIRSIKIDTQKDNMSMQKLLIKNNFKYCGLIYLEDGSERVAFEKLF
ncbi:GNAT family N-acetyltransferase [Clostridium sp.]|uniref:GNAT family N-acetyltransferase n=1 Tax=Clostridium sp. TaxID=1506 RepID=UPI00399364C6